MKLQRVFFLTALLILPSCIQTVSSDTVLNDPAPFEKEAVTNETQSILKGQVEIGQSAIVEYVTAIYPSNWPDTIELAIHGNFPDGCTELFEVLQSRDENLFTVLLKTSRPVNVDCTMALEPFTTSVVLDLRGLTDGIYLAEVDDHVIDFELDVFNEPEDAGG